MAAPMDDEHVMRLLKAPVGRGGDRFGDEAEVQAVNPQATLGHDNAFATLPMAIPHLQSDRP